MRKFYTLTALLFLSFSQLFSQPITDLFQQKNALSNDYRNMAGKYMGLQLNPQRFHSLQQQSPSTLKLQLPFEEGLLKLDLKKVTITSPDFSVVEALPGGGRRTVDYSGASFYQGKIEGRSSSFATISIVNDQVYGIVADNKSNIILGAIENNGRATNEYVLYRETDLQVSSASRCFTGDSAIGEPATIPPSQARLDAVGEPVDIYFECDYKFYQDKGSNTVNVINYVLSFFNNTSLLYANENVRIQVSQILVWTTLDPEAGLNSSSAVLSAFASRMLSTNYIGDYAHFLSTRSLGGGIAYLLSNPCTASKANRTAVSAINNTYSNFPTFSWTVEVVTHELGHNLGSHHTHWCGWPGGPIDWCGPTASSSYIEGSCSTGPLPSAGVGGTIMSYCHLLAVGINLNNGFGPLPGQAIRDVVTAAPCFGTCRMTIDVTKQDASCGLNNGTASVTSTNGTGTVNYTWSNGMTGPTISNLAPGTYHVKANDGANCQVMQVVVISNAGTNLAFTLSPSGTAGFCTGGNLAITATNNPTYTYVWRKDGNVISGATSYNYVATTPGTYAVTVTSAAGCFGTQSVVVSVVAPPAANISAGGPTTFCDGSNVVLNGNAGAGYTYQWYRNSVTISGATSPTYSVTTGGNYTVKVSAGSTCEVTSAPVLVTVNTSPAVNVTASGPTSFCEGKNVTLTTSSGTSYIYQWYKNGGLISGATLPSYTINTAGSYTVTTTLGTCAKTSAATNVVVWSNPTVTVSPTLVTIEKFQNQLLTASGASSYNWTDQPGLLSAGTNSATFNPLTTTNYTIEGTDNNGCKGTANATIVVIGCGNVTNITATAYSPSRVIVRWNNPDGATSDTLQYRKAGASAWNKIFVSGEEHELNGLEPNTNYEYAIIPLCTTTSVYLPSPMGTFKTPSLNGGTYVRLYPNPVTDVSKLEIISAADFSLQVAVFDNIGRRVMTISAKENFPAGQVIKQVDPFILPNGIYHLAVTINEKTQNIKMVVMR